MRQTIPSATRYNRGSVERALTVHFGDAWRADGRGGYSIVTRIGVVRPRTLREAMLMVVAAAEAKRVVAAEAKLAASAA